MVSLRLSTWAVVIGTILLLLLITFGIAIAIPQPLEAWYYRTQIGPGLERDLGFVAQNQKINPAFGEAAFVITSVVPGGRFDQAGIKSGDLPFDFHGYPEISFYRSLENARGGETVVEVVRPGGSSGRGDMATAMRFAVRVPRSRQPNAD